MAKQRGDGAHNHFCSGVIVAAKCKSNASGVEPKVTLDYTVEDVGFTLDDVRELTIGGGAGQKCKLCAFEPTSKNRLLRPRMFFLIYR